MNAMIYSSVTCNRLIYTITFVGDTSPMNVLGQGADLTGSLIYSSARRRPTRARLNELKWRGEREKEMLDFQILPTDEYRRACNGIPARGFVALL
jgi:hypothetical protein